MKYTWFIILGACLLSWLVFAQNKTYVTKVDEVDLTKDALNSFAKIFRTLDYESRQKINCLEDLYHRSRPEDKTLAGFAGLGSSWNFVDLKGNKKYSYIFFKNNNQLPDDMALLLCSPRGLVLTNGVVKRLALTQSLKIIELDEDEFHLRVLLQLKVK